MFRKIFDDIGFFSRDGCMFGGGSSATGGETKNRLLWLFNRMFFNRRG